MNNSLFVKLLGKRSTFIVIFLGLTLTLAGASLWVVSFVYQEARVEPDVSDMADEMSLIYVNYHPNPDDYISAESYLAMGEYQRLYPESQNLQVLTGLSSVEVIGYMVNQFSAGLGVDCTHCHTLANFAADEWEDPVGMANKALARQHLLMSADLNQNWLTQLATLTGNKQPSGVQITCATCHNGVPQPVTWPPNQSTLPDNLRLPTEPITEGIDILNVNGRNDISLDTVGYQQNIMYHMNVSLNVGCTHCHNSRYFPSWEVPAKYYALNMVQMSQHLATTYDEVLRESDPSCQMCHQGAVIPPGAARSAAVIPPQLAPEASPQMASR